VPREKNRPGPVVRVKGRKRGDGGGKKRLEPKKGGWPTSKKVLTTSGEKSCPEAAQAPGRAVRKEGDREKALVSRGGHATACQRKRYSKKGQKTARVTAREKTIQGNQKLGKKAANPLLASEKETDWWNPRVLLGEKRRPSEGRLPKKSNGRRIPPDNNSSHLQKGTEIKGESCLAKRRCQNLVLRQRKKKTWGKRGQP